MKEKVDDRTVNFIRLMAHLRGVNEWQVYERARLLYKLYHDKGYTEKELQTFTMNRVIIPRGIIQGRTLEIIPIAILLVTLL